MQAKQLQPAVRAVEGKPQRGPDPKDPATVSLMHAGSVGSLRPADLTPKPENGSEAKPGAPAVFRNSPKPEPDRLKKTSGKKDSKITWLPLLPGSFHDADPEPKNGEDTCSSRKLYPHLPIHIPDNQEP